ncbi:MAG: nuclear transport factor 2 family protein [Pseudomonadota bacterium]
MFDSKLMEVADTLVANCRAGKEKEGLDALYAPNAVSVEAAAMAEGAPRVFEGLDAIKAKHEQWREMMEEHSSKTDGPYLHGDDKFGVIFELDATDRASGQRMQMKEFGVYTVADGKIVREEFYYTPPPQ